MKCFMYSIRCAGNLRQKRSRRRLINLLTKYILPKLSNLELMLSCVVLESDWVRSEDSLKLVVEGRCL